MSISPSLYVVNMDLHLAGIDAVDPWPKSISSSQLISREITAAGGCAVDVSVAVTLLLLLVEEGQVRRGVRFFRRRAHSRGG